MGIITWIPCPTFPSAPVRLGAQRAPKAGVIQGLFGVKRIRVWGVEGTLQRGDIGVIQRCVGITRVHVSEIAQNQFERTWQLGERL